MSSNDENCIIKSVPADENDSSPEDETYEPPKVKPSKKYLYEKKHWDPSTKTDRE